MDEGARSPEQNAAEALRPLEVVPPAQIAQLVENVGVKKCNLTVVQTLTLGVLAGAFTAFVALGFEHSVANMYLIPVVAMQPGSTIGFSGFLGNLIPVTLGNIVGGGGLVALVYWLVYLRQN